MKGEGGLIILTDVQEAILYPYLIHVSKKKFHLHLRFKKFMLSLEVHTKPNIAKIA